jgi:hypothetical protein
MEGEAVGVTFEEDAMTRLECSVWPLVGGSACVFVLSVILDRLPWQAAFVVAVIAVVAWSWAGPVVVGAALAVIAWLCVTGFDVNRFGYIGINGRADVVRAVVLVVAGVLVASVHAAVEASRRYQQVDPVWVDFHETDPEVKERSNSAL